MRKGMSFREWWSAYGIWVALFFALECFYLDRLGWTLAGWALPISITLSAMTALRLLTNWWQPTRFWTPYVVKWLSWWLANSLASLLVLGIFVGFICAISPAEIKVPLFISLILLPPTVRLFIHMVNDIRQVRRMRETIRTMGLSSSGSGAAVPV